MAYNKIQTFAHKHGIWFDQIQDRLKQARLYKKAQQFDQANETIRSLNKELENEDIMIVSHNTFIYTLVEKGGEKDVQNRG